MLEEEFDLEKTSDEIWLEMEQDLDKIISVDNTSLNSTKPSTLARASNVASTLFASSQSNKSKRKLKEYTEEENQLEMYKDIKNTRELTSDEKAKFRRLTNSLSANKSRKEKNEKIEHLTMENQALKLENEQLRQELFQYTGMTFK